MQLNNSNRFIIIYLSKNTLKHLKFLREAPSFDQERSNDQEKSQFKYSKVSLEDKIKNYLK